MKAIKAEDTRSLEPFRDRIIKGDCLEVMKDIPGESIDMILCDLPYGTTQNKWDSIINLDLLFTEYLRIIKPHGAIVLTSSGLFTAKLMLHAPEIYKYKLIWVKSKATNFLNAKKQPLRKYEDICVFYKAQPTYNPQMSEGEAYDKGVRKDQLTGSYGDFSPKHVKSDGSRYPTDIVYFKTAESEGAVYHPTQKPVELGRYLIRTYTNPGVSRPISSNSFRNAKIQAFSTKVMLSASISPYLQRSSSGIILFSVFSNTLDPLFTASAFSLSGRPFL